MAASKKLLPPQYIMDLYQAYQELASAVQEATAALRADEGLPVYLPKFGASNDDHASLEARREAIASIAQLFIPKSNQVLYNAGLLCASPASVEAVEHMNAAKLIFKAAVKAIKDASKVRDLSGNEVSSLLDGRSDLFRTEELKSAMNTARISALDLWKCYAQIRIMPPGLEVFSWTWATTHSRMTKLTVEDARKKVEQYFEGNQEKLEFYTQLLTQCATDEVLIEKVKLGNQLRANYGYLEDGETQRKSCTISGVVIVQGTTLPRYLWRDDPAESGELVKRLDRKSDIAKDPLIKELDIYRYANTK